MSDVIVTQEIESGGKGGITGSTLKIIAIIAMFIDHFAAILLNGYINTMLPADFYSWSAGDMSAWYVSHPEFARVYIIYIVFRCIGRLGFPIFAFLLVEGFGYTRNVKKYARNLIIFALVSELPFNLGFNSTLLCPRYQNVFFTLFIALLVLCGIKYLPEKLMLNENMGWLVYVGGFLTGVIVTGAVKSSTSFRSFITYETYSMTYWIVALAGGVAGIVVIAIIARNWQPETKCAYFVGSASVLAGFYVAEFAKTDYAGSGVLAIVILYLLRNNKVRTMGASVLLLTVMNYFEVFAFFALIPVSKYNGKRGINLKYFFYAFYPVHILLIYIVTYVLGYAQFAIK